MTYLMLLFVLAHVLLVIVMHGIWQELKKMREWLHACGMGASSPLLRRREVTSSKWIVYPQLFAIWVFRGGRWELERESLQPGVDPGPPPSLPGAFEGDRVKVECAR